MASTTAGIGDNSYEGKGALLCSSCGEPLRDHRLAQRCPTLHLPVDARFTVGHPVVKGRNPDSHTAARKRRARRKAEQEEK